MEEFNLHWLAFNHLGNHNLRNSQQINFIQALGDKNSDTLNVIANKVSGIQCT